MSTIELLQGTDLASIESANLKAQISKLLSDYAADPQPELFLEAAGPNIKTLLGFVTKVAPKALPSQSVKPAKTKSKRTKNSSEGSKPVSIEDVVHLLQAASLPATAGKPKALHQIIGTLQLAGDEEEESDRKLMLKSAKRKLSKLIELIGKDAIPPQVTEANNLLKQFIETELSSKPRSNADKQPIAKLKALQSKLQELMKTAN